MPDTEGTMRSASMEQQVFGEMDRRSFGLNKLDSPEGFLFTLLITGLLLIPVVNVMLLGISLMISSIQAQVQNGGAEPGVSVIATSFVIAFLAPSIAVTALFFLGRRQLGLVRTQLRESDIAARLMHGWRVEYNDGPLASGLRRFELMSLQRRALLSEFVEAFRQLDYCLGLRSQPHPPMLVNGLLIWVVLAIGLFQPLVTFRLTAHSGPASTMLVALAAMIVLEAVLITPLAVPIVRQLVQLSLLREHLRDLDNGVLEIELPQGIGESSDA